MLILRANTPVHRGVSATLTGIQKPSDTVGTHLDKPQSVDAFPELGIPAKPHAHGLCQTASGVERHRELKRAGDVRLHVGAWFASRLRCSVAELRLPRPPKRTQAVAPFSKRCFSEALRILESARARLATWCWAKRGHARSREFRMTVCSDNVGTLSDFWPPAGQTKSGGLAVIYHQISLVSGRGHRSAVNPILICRASALVLNCSHLGYEICRA